MTAHGEVISFWAEGVTLVLDRSRATRGDQDRELEFLAVPTSLLTLVDCFEHEATKFMIQTDYSAAIDGALLSTNFGIGRGRAWSDQFRCSCHEQTRRGEGKLSSFAHNSASRAAGARRQVFQGMGTGVVTSQNGGSQQKTDCNLTYQLWTPARVIQTHSHIMFYLCFPDVCAARPGTLGNKVLEGHAEARRYAASTFPAARKEDHDSRLTPFSMITSSFRLESIEVPKQAHVFRVCPVCVCFVLQACRIVWCPTGLIFLRGCPRSALERCDWACRHAALCVDRSST